MDVRDLVPKHTSNSRASAAKQCVLAMSRQNEVWLKPYGTFGVSWTSTLASQAKKLQNNNNKCVSGI